MTLDKYAKTVSRLHMPTTATYMERTMSNVISKTNAVASWSGRRNKSPEDTAASIELERIDESLSHDRKQKHDWMTGATKARSVPQRLSTGNIEIDATGIALAVNKTADMLLFILNGCFRHKRRSWEFAQVPMTSQKQH
jgi:hypothetical protein